MRSSVIIQQFDCLPELLDVFVCIGSDSGRSLRSVSENLVDADRVRAECIEPGSDRVPGFVDTMVHAEIFHHGLESSKIGLIRFAPKPSVILLHEAIEDRDEAGVDRDDSVFSCRGF